MSLEQVNAFYDLLNSDQALYEQYYNKCSNKGVFGIWNWDKTKIVDFAASIGYNFTETELDFAWFGENVSLCVGLRGYL
ncbi:MAG: Nif11 family protein [Pelatocladus maniniholoensis HA4357-MV3]|uniref:Nif11 family protein n=1 Tax=Pelatocladus maniniholoensis HA4357-MV3 TaxID=1117104 RepID=A0A9E3HD41_9NOST|nr:Nif11 family protein [Pelatocladus maniniholoensis HA4357-MV3]